METGTRNNHMALTLKLKKRTCNLQVLLLFAIITAPLMEVINLSRYEVTTVYKDGSKQQNHYNTQDYAIMVYLSGVNYPDIVKSVWVYDSVKQSIILDSRKSGKVAISELEDL